MKKLSCDVIRDLLPLYAEHCASADTCALVEEHLADCPDCMAELEKLREPLVLPMETEQELMRRIKKKQNRKLIRTICICIVAVLLCVVVPVCFFLHDESVQYSADDISAEVTDTGETRLVLSDRAQGAVTYYVYQQDEDGSMTVYLPVPGKQHPSPAVAEPPAHRTVFHSVHLRG